MHARDGLGRIKHGRARRDSVLSERRSRRVRDRPLRQRMRQRFKRSIVLERQMSTFVRFNEDDNRCRVCLRRRNQRFRRGTACCARRCNVLRTHKAAAERCCAKRKPMRIRKEASVPMPRSERRQVVTFSGHSEVKKLKTGDVS
jgi:hypothetical protein